MKTIGLLGGMSWESTATYYRLLNEGVKKARGGLHSAKILMHSFDFAEIEAQQMSGSWTASGETLATAARNLENAGADCIVICTNTMHKVTDQIEKKITIPILHIADAAADAIKAKGYKKVSILGSDFTMTQDFYKGRLKARHDIEAIAPNEADRKIVDQVIYEELCRGTIRSESRQEYVRIIEKLHEEGAKAAILGCTEIPLLVTSEHTDVPLIDTTQMHAEAAVRFALES